MIAETFGENRKNLFLFLTFTGFFTVFFIRSKQGFYFIDGHLVFTIADGYVLMSNLFLKAFFLIPAYLFLLSHFLKNDGEVQRVLRSRRREKLWAWSCGKVLAASLCITIWEMLLIAGTGAAQGMRTVNWSEKESVFWIETGMVLRASKSLAEVAGMFFLTMMLTCVLAGLAYVWILELFHSILLASGACLTWGIAEYFAKPFLLNRLCMQHLDWLRNEWSSLVAAAVVLVCLGILGLWAAKRREYY